MNRPPSEFKLKAFITAVMVFLLISAMTISGMATTAFAEDFALGDIPLNKETYEKYIKKPSLERLEAVHPSSYDARDAGIVTPAKNQGSCGSCWAFASVGALESHILKKYAGGPYDLSEQQLLDCNTMGYDCTGGSSNAPQYWETTGPVTETCYPYTAVDGTCSYSCTEMSYRVTGWHTVTQTEWDFKDSCYNEGPSYWRFQVYSDFSNGFGGGWWYTAGPGDVYVNAGGSFDRGGHAVLLIGWDDAKGAYLCKNSWGTTGGPNGDGTFWIAYSGHANDLGFGMSNFDITGDFPTVTTTAVSLITSNTASSGGNVISDGGTTVTARGVCWSTSSNPTISDGKTTDGSGTGSFTSSIIGLSPGTTYHVRAYATNSAGTAYGSDVTFATLVTTPTVTTTAVSSITSNSASSGGNVTNDGGAPVTARGVCWSTSSNPTIANSKTTDGTGTGSFTSSLTGLSPRTTYHLRAYATNTAGSGYGNDLSFTTANEDILYVSSDGDCGTKSPCYDSIQDAIDDAPTESVILVKQGTYAESISLGNTKTLLIKGGYNSTYDQQTANTTFIQAPVQTSIQAPSGTLTFQMLTIKP